MSVLHGLEQDLGNGLLLRRSRAEDMEELAAFNQRIHSMDDDEDVRDPQPRLAAWTRDLMGGGHPRFGAEDFTVVVEQASGRIVSAACLISQTWDYEGVPFGVGRPELVGTEPAYRRRGLIRAQFEVLHQLSRSRGEWVQAITGIPYYYRQFGYEMLLNLGGERRGFAAQLPTQAQGYTVRPAQVDDLPWIADCERLGGRRGVVHCVRSPAEWRYELDGACELNVNRKVLMVLTHASGQPVGFFAHEPYVRPSNVLAATILELMEGVSWYDALPCVLRYLLQKGNEIAAQDGKPCLGVELALGEEHPAYQVAERWLPVVKKPYAWYVRLSDLAGFLRLIAPALEVRLAQSLYAGVSGEFKVGFYRTGLHLTFEAGRLTACEAYELERWQAVDAAFPGLSFLQLLFGYRSLDELRNAFADCWTNERGRALLTALFPRKPSNVWPIS